MSPDGQDTVSNAVAGTGWKAEGGDTKCGFNSTTCFRASGSGVKPPFSDPRFVLALTGIHQRVVQIKASENVHLVHCLPQD